MKKIISLAFAALLMASCSEDTMDNINKDNANPPVDKVPARLQITDAIMSTGFTTTSGAYAWYLSSITEQEFGSGNNQLMKVELRNANELASSTTYNNEWNGTYSTLMNLKQIIAKTSPEGTSTDAGQTDILGMAQVLTDLNFGVLTDLHGDIPCSEALQGQNNIQPKLDAQKDVYDYIFKTLDDAIANLSSVVGTETANAAEQDILFGNDNQAWLASAYALKARYLLHTMVQNPSVLPQVKEACNKAIELGFPGMYITSFNGVTCDNPWSAYVWSRCYTGCSSTVVNIMLDTNDPRLMAYCYDYSEAGDGSGRVYFNPGDEEGAKESAMYYYPLWLDNGDQSIQLMSEAELYFILAEVQARLGEDATEAFQNAVAASFADYENMFGFDFGAANFIASFATVDLKTIMVQKYISQIRDEQIETYNDLRRCMALNEEYVKMTNPYNNQSGINRWPHLLPYGNNSVISNAKIKEAYGDGTYIFTKKAWLFNK